MYRHLILGIPQEFQYLFVQGYAGLVCGEANACYVRWVVTVYNCINPEYACQSRIVIFSVNQMRGEYTVNTLHTYTHRDTRQSIMTYPTQRVMALLMGGGEGTFVNLVNQ